MLLSWKCLIIIKNKNSNFNQDEMYKLEMLHDKALKDAKLDSDARLASLTNELDTKWSEKLR